MEVCPVCRRSAECGKSSKDEEPRMHSCERAKKRCPDRNDNPMMHNVELRARC